MWNCDRPSQPHQQISAIRFILYRFIVLKCFCIPLYIILHCITVINIVKKIPTKQYWYEFSFYWLSYNKILTENIRRIFEKSYSKSCHSLNFCNDLLRMLRIECPQKRKKHFWKFIFWTKLLARQNF